MAVGAAEAACLAEWATDAAGVAVTAGATSAGTLPPHAAIAIRIAIDVETNAPFISYLP